jgi:hypothetical protein
MFMKKNNKRKSKTCQRHFQITFCNVYQLAAYQHGHIFQLEKLLVLSMDD